MEVLPPTLDELTALLQRYFIGATPAQAAALHAEVTAVLGNPRRAAGEASTFDPANGGAGFGLAWREELAYKHRRPSPLELAAWLASTVTGFPPPRPYCPDVFVGTWQQVMPESGPQWSWELRLDGTFICDEPELRGRNAWCVHRQASTHVGDVILLDDDLRIAHRYLAIAAITPNELVLEQPGTTNKYQLVRR